jgi:hypothetical protein
MFIKFPILAKITVMAIALALCFFGIKDKSMGSESCPVALQEDALGVHLVNQSDHLLLVTYQVARGTSILEVNTASLDSHEAYRDSAAKTAGDVTITSIDVVQ